MPRLRHSRSAALIAVLALVSACGQQSVPATPPETPVAAAEEPRAALGLMTSLPLYWPLGADVSTMASGSAALPWQRSAIEQAYTITPLDTLSPIPGLSPDAPATDPLAGLDRLAIVQPRGLSPADNVALDLWVRSGGRLLLVLDPALTGDYDLPLGDPRRPADSALVPPVVARWGLGLSFDDRQPAEPAERMLGKAALPLLMAGQFTVIDPAAAQCAVLAEGAAARCRIGAGQVTLIADAAVFEHPELAGEAVATLRAVVGEAVQ